VLCDADMEGHLDRVARWAGGRAEVVERRGTDVLMKIEKESEV